MLQDGSSNKSISEQSSYEESDGDMFGNLAPIANKTSTSTLSDHQNKFVLAKMKRLIGPSFNSNTNNLKGNKTTPVQQKKQKQNKKGNNKKSLISEESKVQSGDQNLSQESRQRSRDKKLFAKTAESIKSNSAIKKSKSYDAAFLSIQKQVVKQNDHLTSNKIENKKVQTKFQQSESDLKKSYKFDKFAEMEKLLYVPVEELPVFTKTSEEMKEEKREKKRLDRMMEKKYKEYKVGKVKDQASNCVFNGIEDYFN